MTVGASQSISDMYAVRAGRRSRIGKDTVVGAAAVVAGGTVQFGIGPETVTEAGRVAGAGTGGIRDARGQIHGTVLMVATGGIGVARNPGPVTDNALTEVRLDASGDINMQVVRPTYIAQVTVARSTPCGVNPVTLLRARSMTAGCTVTDIAGNDGIRVIDGHRSAIERTTGDNIKETGHLGNKVEVLASRFDRYVRSSGVVVAVGAADPVIVDMLEVVTGYRR